jgi:hypothetical protein
LNVFYSSSVRSSSSQSTSLFADSFDAVPALRIAKILAWLAFIARLGDVHPKQTLWTSPPLRLNLSVSHPGLLGFDPSLPVGLVFALCAANIFLVIVSKMVMEMILASEWTSPFLALSVIAGILFFLI